MAAQLEDVPFALVSDLVGDNYESIADAVRTVAGLDREPDPYHDVVPLSDAARAEGIRLPADCQQGWCATCAAEPLSGEVEALSRGLSGPWRSVAVFQNRNGRG